jgi:hypothetical protein
MYEEWVHGTGRGKNAQCLRYVPYTLNPRTWNVEGNFAIAMLIRFAKARGGERVKFQSVYDFPPLELLSTLS